MQGNSSLTWRYEYLKFCTHLSSHWLVLRASSCHHPRTRTLDDADHLNAFSDPGKAWLMPYPALIGNAGVILVSNHGCITIPNRGNDVPHNDALIQYPTRPSKPASSLGLCKPTYAVGYFHHSVNPSPRATFSSAEFASLCCKTAGSKAGQHKPDFILQHRNT
jgi:hypothetical protein